jgi:hypothetical protein
MEENPIKIFCQYLVLHFVVITLLVGFQPIGQQLTDECYFSKCPSTLEYTATITEKSNKSSQIPRTVRVRNIDPTILHNIIEQHLASRIWNASSLESFHALPLHSLSIVLCQLRR